MIHKKATVTFAIALRKIVSDLAKTSFYHLPLYFTLLVVITDDDDDGDDGGDGDFISMLAGLRQTKTRGKMCVHNYKSVQNTPEVRVCFINIIYY